MAELLSLLSKVQSCFDLLQFEQGLVLSHLIFLLRQDTQGLICAEATPSSSISGKILNEGLDEAKWLLMI
jgi:hypothetical protein